MRINEQKCTKRESKTEVPKPNINKPFNTTAQFERIWYRWFELILNHHLPKSGFVKARRVYRYRNGSICATIYTAACSYT